MKTMSFWLSTILIALSLFVSPQTALAQFTAPQFPICPQGAGTVQVAYSTGEHAIVGIEGLKSGSDKVFSLGNNNFLQCFCPVDNSTGIQTSWLAAGDISQVDQIDLQTQGWILIPNGADWGLEAQPYLAKNSDFSCHGGSSDSNNNSSNNSENNSSSANNSVIDYRPQGEVLSAATLAATNSENYIWQILGFSGLGIASLCYGISLKKQS